MACGSQYVSLRGAVAAHEIVAAATRECPLTTVVAALMTQSVAMDAIPFNHTLIITTTLYQNLNVPARALERGLREAKLSMTIKNDDSRRCASSSPSLSSQSRR